MKIKLLYKKIEAGFEKLSTIAIRILGNSITFIFALALIFFYFADERVYHQPRNKTIMDVIFSITFLSIFIIQKSVNRFSSALHLKMNELVAAHDKASNRMINIEEKSEEELRELAKHYSTIAEEVQASGIKQKSHSIERVLDRQDTDSKPTID
jgi:low affinity Fe/Cu permease